MALTLQRTSIFVTLLVLGTWLSQARCRLLQETTNNNSSSSSSVSERFEQWMAHYGRTYKDEAEKQMRFNIFKTNVEAIEKFKEEGKETHELSINQFADQTNEEFLSTKTGFLKMSNMSTGFESEEAFAYQTMSDIPSSVDWRTRGAVTDAKFQGSCGGCWAFSAVAAIEGLVKIKTGNLYSFSEQQLIDCVPSPPSKGCYGGNQVHAFQYIIQNKGITATLHYPYKGGKGTCNAQAASKIVGQIKGYKFVPSNNENALLQAVSTQPVSVIIDSSSWQFYSGGVFSGSCGTQPNHAVAIVGYGTQGGIPYWIIKNSWGSSWGENGFIRMRRSTGSAQGLCGINTYAYIPTF